MSTTSIAPASTPPPKPIAPAKPAVTSESRGGEINEIKKAEPAPAKAKATEPAPPPPRTDDSRGIKLDVSA